MEVLQDKQETDNKAAASDDELKQLILFLQQIEEEKQVLKWKMELLLLLSPPLIQEFPRSMVYDEPSCSQQKQLFKPKQTHLSFHSLSV